MTFRFVPFKDAPRITNISGEQIVNKGKRVSLFCVAEGNPAPNITWTKVTDKSRVNFPLTVLGSQDEGLYRCTAENGVGSPVEKDVNITVHCKCHSYGCYDSVLFDLKLSLNIDQHWVSFRLIHEF